MRTLMFLFGLCLFTMACDKEEVSILPVQEDQMELELHAIFSCGGEFDFGSETAEDWGQRIVDAVTADGLTVISFEVDFQKVEHQGFCGNCAPTGDFLKVVIPEDEAEEFRALGFQ